MNLQSGIAVYTGTACRVGGVDFITKPIHQVEKRKSLFLIRTRKGSNGNLAVGPSDGKFLAQNDSHM